MRIKISDELSAALKNLKRKAPSLFSQVQKKINQIASLDDSALTHFKNLRGNMSKYKRVHVGSFVLFFYIEGDIILFDRLLHHDDAY